MIEKPQPQAGSMEAIDDFAAAPPGHSLTEDNSKWAWGRPPQMVDPEQVLQDAIDSLKDGKTQLEMVKLLMVGASVEMLVEGYLFQGFQDGKFTPDVGLLIKAPLSFYIASIAEEGNIPYRFFENSDALEQGVMDDDTFMQMMKDNNPKMFDYIRESVNEGIRAGKNLKKPDESFMDLDEGDQE
tara:strand:- start:7319 stop:7870 length:552 start_codon:yes stop_codon:yes gene_type:complete